MTAGDLVSLVTDTAFALVFVAALTRALRERRRASLEAALFFGAIAMILLGERIREFDIDPPSLTAIQVSLLLVTPYLLLRQVDELVGVPLRVQAAALAGLLASLVAVWVFTRLPLPVLVAVITYFGCVMSYAAVLLMKGTLRTSGVARQRTRAAAFGSIILALAVAALGAETLFPVFDGVTLILVLASALAYFAAFATPAVLKRAWVEPELRAFIEHVSAIAPLGDLPTIASEVAREMSRVTGGRAVVGLDTEIPAAEGEGGAQTSISAPLIARGHRYGTATVEFRSEMLFPEDDQALVALLADQAAMVIEGARMYQDVSRVNRELERATKAKSEFLAGMSHELRTPMNAILGFSDLLVEQLGVVLTPAQQRYFRNIKDAGDHLLDLINEVLDLSKVEAGRLELRPEAIGLSALVEPVIESTRRAAQAKHVAFTTDEVGRVVVRVDPGRVRQILYNLLSNAVKFTPEDGRVVLRAGMDGQALVLEVEDTGIGIPADRQERVFGTFERLHEGRVDVAGTGLGLALTKKLTELHHGEITFRTEEGRGTTFRVRIPDALAVPISGARVLVIDDTERDAQLIAAVASQLGIPAELVPTAGAGRDSVRRDPPVGIVLDLRLPDERGEVLLKELKSDPVTQAIPVLVVSVEDDEGRSRILGAEDHLMKPIDRERVAAWLRKLAAPRARGEAGQAR